MQAFKLRLPLLLTCILAAVGLQPARALAVVPTYTVGWSVYAGWNPYFYMQKSGILKKWADKYGIAIKVQRFDYAASLDSFVAKNIDACTMTNMEALDMPAAAGVDSTAIIVGDYSNGNDAVLVRNGLSFQTLPSKPVMLVQKTVSEYLLERGMVLNGQQSQLGKLHLINTSDSDIVAAFSNNKSNEAVVTWKPLVSQIVSDKGVHSIFDSSQIPGEILDLLVVRTDILNTPDGQKFAKAITGAWYETVQQVAAGQAPALKYSAAASGDSVESYKEQLKTTALFVTPKSAVDFRGRIRPAEEDGSGAAVLLSRTVCWGRGSSRSMMSQSLIRTVRSRARRIAFGCDSTRCICRLRTRESFRLMANLSPFDIQARPNRLLGQALSCVIFVVCIGLYMQTSVSRHKENPEDRVVPNQHQLLAGIRSAVLEPAEEDDYIPAENASKWERLHHSMIWKDTASSGRRFLISLLLLIPAVVLALHIGLFPWFGAGFLRFVLFFDKIVALSLLPILFIVFGIDEWSKIALIVIGVAPTMILDVTQMVRAVPQEQIVKAFTLDANNFDVAYRVVFKQVLPQVINSLRLNLKPMMLFLFAGEMIAASDGLAYRIAIMRRHMGMDVILPYVLWVALLLFLIDLSLRMINRRMHPWFAV